MKTIYILILLFTSTLFFGCTPKSKSITDSKWSLSILPPSVRLDPTSNEIIEQRFINSDKNAQNNLLKSNWIYDGEKVSIHSARGEYVSFQLILTNQQELPLSNIKIEMSNFEGPNGKLNIEPELFLEWSVKVITPSTGYPKTSLGKGWYPDALIPFKYIQMDSSKVQRWTYPLWIPDFNNRIENQKSLVVWIDQYVPLERINAKPGVYQSTINVTVDDEIKLIPIKLSVWDFEISNQNMLGASLQQEGFVSQMNDEDALGVYQLLKRNRISVMDPTYKPLLNLKNQQINYDWNLFDNQLKKYFTGEAFTSKYGYEYGPGYGEPIENFVLPFDVYGKYNTDGWPNIGKPKVERNPENIALYIDAVKQFRSHLKPIFNPLKTDLTIYLNGLDESYFKEAWSRMVYFGDLFHEHYPEAHFRIDGAYSDEAMEYVSNSIDYWGSHTINYNHEKVKEYQEKGIGDWLYGPMLYESEVNSWVGSSTFIDMPLVNDRAISWACWKYDAHSWLSWGIGAGWKRAWYDPETWKDAYKASSGSDINFPYKKLNGNGMLIYSGGIIPNVDEPCASIRLKMLRNGVQEYEYMRKISELNGNKEQANKIVDEIINEPFGKEGIGVIDVWDFDPEKWANARIQLGELIDNMSK
ncbi:glycoside hydrolase domain-containing protein [uncultured Sunxiuqinia sp.]|uniref:glycoside hydrolase domain-containing protein n=1 Tax=uncultured Sunxiuqinia sp. TaxID=1573825 RepID=UPI002AA71CF4|nr:glycoside hydrolase domain-containing protein [uncultured Sunxiuqinia sp.]